MMGVLLENEQAWIPPPKKKWIRHYFLSEVPKDFVTYSALQNPGTPPASPPRVPLPPPAPPTSTPVHAPKVNGVGGSPSGGKVPPPTSPPYYQPPENSYLAARLTAPTPASNGGSASSSPASEGFVKVKNISMTLPTTTPISSPSAHIPSGGVPSSPSSVNGNISPQELKKRAGAGTREVHNKLEKNRRAHLKECFEMLRRQLPPCGHDDKKPSNLTVLHSAIRYIQTLRRKERDFEHEMERLAREKISFQQRLSSLKKEISSQCDSVDFSNLLPDVPAQALKSSQVHMGGSLSKPLPFDSDDDFEFDEEDETMQKPPSPQHSASTSTASGKTERGHLSDVEDLSGGNSRPGSSRDGGCSPTMPVAAPATNPNALRPSAVVEHPGRSSNIGEVLREVVRKPSSPRTEPAPSPQNLGTKLSIQPQPAPIQLTQVSNKTFGFLQHVGEHISRQSHVQLVPTSHGFAGSGPTLVAPTAIQLVAAPSGLRMLATAPHPDQRSQVSRDDVSKVKMSTFITTTESSRLPGGAEINVISSSASQNVPVVRGNMPGKPINLSANASASLLSTTSAPPILNGSVISHGSALHRQTLPQGQNNTTVLSSGATAPLTHTVTHHLAPGQGIAHVVAASGQSHISTLGPLVAAPVTMVTPGSHPSGVHILATAKPPFLLKHQVLPTLAYQSGQLVKPVMMVSSAASVMSAPRPPTSETASPNGVSNQKSTPS
ncbi:max-binding protein MNT-like isoform X1 [Cloeon dipterum]|uniref:max-binding protein MNT-like isoform X1 n=1 Tax=Cloeon dipterum TaxID=197152 RepID=UPI00322072E6